MRFDLEEVHEAEVVETGLARRGEDGLSRQHHLDAIDDELFEKHAEIVSAMAEWANIDPASDEVPPEWVAKMGLEKATKVWRIARASWESNKNAPVGLANSVKTHAGLSAARAKRQSTVPRNLNMQAVFITLPAGTFERIEPIEIKEK